MAMTTYPEGLPQPLRENSGFKPANSIVRTEMVSGRARQRPGFEFTPDTATFVWHLTGPQAQLFKSWVRSVRAGWFTMKFTTPEGFFLQDVRFTQTPDGPRRVGVDTWWYSGEMEIRDRFTFSGEWAELLPGYILLADIFDFAMNEEWPVYIAVPLTTEDFNQLTTEDAQGFVL